MERICFRCKLEIKDHEDYFAMIEMNGEKEVKKDYVHKICWNTFISELGGANESLRKSNYLLDAMTNKLRDMGMIPEQKQEVQIG